MRYLPKKFPLLLLALLFLIDTGYSFIQYYHQPLDGDMGWNLVPAAEVRPILRDPLGWRAIVSGQTYPNPNRFFAHWTYREYLLRVPGALRRFLDPVPSVYLACALAKVLTHLALLLLLARLLVGPRAPDRPAYLLLACLLAPFFQAAGYRSHMGIIDVATTYVFFYALPAAWLLLLALPFGDWALHGRAGRLRKWQGGLLGLLAIPVCLSGPLNPGVVLVATLTGAAAWRLGGMRPLPRHLLRLLVWVNLLAAYSLFLGRYNSLTLASARPLAELYATLPWGIVRQFTGKLAFPLLFAALGLQYWLLGRKGDGAAMRRVFRWVTIACCLYLVLLPLGGYRDYRLTILRYDTILPVTLALVTLYAAGARYLLPRLSGHYRGGFIALLIAVAAIYTNADTFTAENHRCERAALDTIAAARRGPVPLSGNCGVVLWKTYPEPAPSALPAVLLARWGITESPRRYYHR